MPTKFLPPESAPFQYLTDPEHIVILDTVLFDQNGDPISNTEGDFVREIRKLSEP